ncbi:lipopolysaccharide transport system permease protein [Flavobacterium resistens]|uniref:ABC transporter permease n=1 Tax=Flavobacterium resistens TaxID=443612 RepID=A0A521ET59_9FLAO|nr:ABC transporter permease [Flavobacterium resistens]MRX67921.1 ABC transporter permease [Flavobacterium resistens]SMO86601.1 lipopolysaccharide transport system permease protein [Flavobacterium resistens]
MELKITVYQKTNNKRIGKLLRESFSDMYSSRFLAKQLAIRDIKAQYRQSFLGIIWAFITPLSTALVWIILSNSGTLSLTDTGVPYPVFVFSGTLLWSIVIDAINAPMLNTNGARGILSKINFPKEALILSGVYKLISNSLIKIVLLLFFLIVYKVGLHSSILLFPLAFLAIIFFGTTIGLFITPLGMLYNDVGKIVSLGLSFLMYATPVVYVIPKSGLLKTLMEINPLTPLLLTTRNLLFGQHIEYLAYYFGLLAACIPLFFIGLVFYRISIPIIVERMSA